MVTPGGRQSTEAKGHGPQGTGSTGKGGGHTHSPTPTHVPLTTIRHHRGGDDHKANPLISPPYHGKPPLSTLVFTHRSLCLQDSDIQINQMAALTGNANMTADADKAQFSDIVADVCHEQGMDAVSADQLATGFDTLGIDRITRLSAWGDGCFEQASIQPADRSRFRQELLAESNGLADSLVVATVISNIVKRAIAINRGTGVQLSVAPQAPPAAPVVLPVLTAPVLPA